MPSTALTQPLPHRQALHCIFEKLFCNVEVNAEEHEDTFTAMRVGACHCPQCPKTLSSP